MKHILDLFFFLLGVGFSKAIVEPIAKRIFQRKVLAIAPSVFEFLDPIMPAAIKHLSGEQLDEMLRNRLHKMTGESWDKKDLELLWTLYDPRKNANRLL